MIIDKLNVILYVSLLFQSYFSPRADVHIHAVYIHKE
jgi:hypothetical protein